MSISVPLSPATVPTGYLTTVSLVRSRLGISNTNDDTRLTYALAAASRLVEKYCDRLFLTAATVEYFSGGDTPYLKLSTFPVTVGPTLSVAQSALQVSNSLSTVQAARVSVDSSVLTLSRTASGVTTTNALALATYTTLTTLATAITAVGNGWTASEVGTYHGYASSALRDTQGAADAKNGPAALEVFVDGPSRLRCNPDTGTIYLFGRTPCGYQNIRASYTGGYSTVPDDVQEATAAVAGALYKMGTTDHSLQSETLGDYGYKNAVKTADLASIAPDAALLLAAYKRPRL